MPSGFIHLIIERHYTEPAMVLQLYNPGVSEKYW